MSGTSPMFLAMLSGLTLSTGAVLLFGLMTGRIVAPQRLSAPDRWQRWARRVWRGPYRSPAARKTHQQRLIIGFAAGAAVWGYTAMPVFGLATMIALPGLPWLLGAGKIETEAIARLAAIESWTRRMKDIVGNGIGLQQAIIASLVTTPPQIHTEIRDLVARLQSGADAEIALLQLAHDLDDEYADEVIGALIQQATISSTKLGQRLADIADDTAEIISDRTENQADRAEGQHTLKVLTAMVLGMAVFGIVTPSYVQPFATGFGQVILMGGFTLIVALLLRARTINMPPPPERFLRDPGEAAPNQQEDLAAVDLHPQPQEVLA